MTKIIRPLVTKILVFIWLNIAAKLSHTSCEKNKTLFSFIHLHPWLSTTMILFFKYDFLFIHLWSQKKIHQYHFQLFVFNFYNIYWNKNVVSTHYWVIMTSLFFFYTKIVLLLSIIDKTSLFYYNITLRRRNFTNLPMFCQ